MELVKLEYALATLRFTLDDLALLAKAAVEYAEEHLVTIEAGEKHCHLEAMACGIEAAAHASLMLGVIEDDGLALVREDAASLCLPDVLFRSRGFDTEVLYRERQAAELTDRRTKTASKERERKEAQIEDARGYVRYLEAQLAEAGNAEPTAVAT